MSKSEPVATVKGDLAHIGPQGEPHHLRDHLRSVGTMAAGNATAFTDENWARLAGLWHDLGKYRSGFQTYIRQTQDEDAHIEGRVGGRDKTHSAAGAIWAQEFLKKELGQEGEIAGRILSYIIAGHHAGLDNWFEGLKERLEGENAKKEYTDTMDAAPPEDIRKPDIALLSLSSVPVDSKKETPGAFALWVRMLFSSLVDADFLDTEKFHDEKKSVQRQGYPSIEELLYAFNRHMENKANELKVHGLSETLVNQQRVSVLAQCREKASRPSGVFTLTVPTGGGKTLSSMAFALSHAQEHNKRRVIYAIPYTSIIEQTADIFREIFGEPNVVEHHSNVESDEREETQRSRLACENWDAPVVVTTNVQLFESLFARKTSRCRKLHNLVNAVIVLDEAQLLPVDFLQPILDVLDMLVKDYGVTLVLCTATQPALTSSDCFDPKFRLRGFSADRVTEIVDDVQSLYKSLNRVKVCLPANLDTHEDWLDIAEKIESHPAVLAIVNRRKDAADLYRLLRNKNEKGIFHLSALMCAQHRSDVVARIRQSLKEYWEGSLESVRVVSTQLVEAGVDLDFPVVYRAMAGLDSVAQAAGRCNREGTLEEGTVHVFVPPTSPPPGLLRQAASECRTLWKELSAGTDAIGVGLYPRYFRRLYARNIDRKKICAMLKVGRAGDVRFRDAAEAFKLIDDKDGAVVLVRYQSERSGEDIEALLGLLESKGPKRSLMRKLQRFNVTIYKDDAKRLLDQGEIRLVKGCPGLYMQSNDSLYDLNVGFKVDYVPGDPVM